MKIWKIISGILSCVLFLLVILQSMAAGLSNLLTMNGESSGFAGLLVACFMLTGGIVSIVTRKSDGIGGDIALISIFSVAFIVGIFSAGSYKDLIIWSWWCMINAIIATIDLVYRVAYEKAFINNIVESRLRESSMPGGNVENWYYQYNGQWYGPIKRSKVAKLTAKGRFNPLTPVYFEGSQQIVSAKDSALYGYIPGVLLPENSNPGIIVPTILIPLAVFALAIVITAGFGLRSSDETKPSEKTSVIKEAQADSITPVQGSAPKEMNERMDKLITRMDTFEDLLTSETENNSSAADENKNNVKIDKTDESNVETKNTTNENVEGQRTETVQEQSEKQSENSDSVSEESSNRDSKEDKGAVSDKDSAKETTGTNTTEKSESADASTTVFSPQDVSDATIESIQTYGDYLDMYRYIIDDYFAYYENTIINTPLYSQEAFETEKKSLDDAFESQNQQYGSMRNQKIVGKDKLVQFLKDYRDQLRAVVDNIKDSFQDLDQTLGESGIDLSEYGYNFNY